MGRGGTGLSSCASAWSGAAVTSKKDRDLIAAGSLPSIALSPNRVRSRFGKLEYAKLIFGLLPAAAFRRPWSIDELEACFVVIDSTGQNLFRGMSPAGRSAAKLLATFNLGIRPGSTWD